MKIKREITVKKSITEKVLCNRCGREIGKAFSDTYEDYVEFHKQWNYFSDMDGQKHSFDICAKCYIEIINEFKIPIETDDISY